MIQRALLALIALSVYSTTGFAQAPPNIFVSFGQGANVSSFATVDVSDGTGSAFVFVETSEVIDAFDLNLTVSDTSVVEVTNTQVFNSDIEIPPGILPGGEALFLGTRFSIDEMSGDPPGIIIGAPNLDPATVTPTPGPDGILGNADDGETGTPDLTGGGLFGANVDEEGIDPGRSDFDQGFDPAVGASGAFLFGQVDFNIVGPGTATFTLGPGAQPGSPSLLQLPNDENGGEDVVLDDVVTFGSGTLTVTDIPEPSSAGLLVLGLAGIFARRRR